MLLAVEHAFEPRARRSPEVVRDIDHVHVSRIGALNEGLSARAVAEMQKEVNEPRVQAVLAAIAKDEARHAAHGFDVVRWCVATGGQSVIDGLRGL